MNLNDLLGLRPVDFEDRDVSVEEILGWFETCDAYWMHDGNPGKPHAELTSGKCSNGYFNCPEVLKYPGLNEILACQLAVLVNDNLKGRKVDWVIGSPYSAITFSYEVAKALKAIHAFAEKDPADPRRMIWKRMTIPKGSVVLQVEELITSGGTFRKVRRAVEEGNKYPVNFLSIVATLVHRPSRLPADYGDIKVISLIEREIWAVDQKDCPLCRAGSPRYRPKTHWKKLTGKRN